MAIEVFNRYEKKFMLSEEQFQAMLLKIRDYMEPDAYSRDGEFYTINNIYYDTCQDDLIRKSIEKPVYKEKLRLRSYGVPAMEDKVYLEIKKKYNGLVNKRRTAMTLSEAYDYMEYGTIPDNPWLNKQIMKEIDYMCHRQKLLPKVYISYDRKAYFAKEQSDFRITFDTNIRTRRYDVGLEKGSFGEQLLPERTWLMEIKILDAVPLWFTEILSELALYPTSFSKYGTEYKQFVQRQREGEKIICLNHYLQQQLQKQQEIHWKSVHPSSAY